MTFDLPEHDVPNSPEGQLGGGERSVSTPEESETHADLCESEPSPERLRTQVPSSCVTASPPFQESFSQLITSQSHPRGSPDVELTALSLSHLTMCDDAPTPERTDADRSCVSERPGDSVQFRDLCAGELRSEQSSNLRKAIPVSEKILVRYVFWFTLKQHHRSDIISPLQCPKRQYLPIKSNSCSVMLQLQFVPCSVQCH